MQRQALRFGLATFVVGIALGAVAARFVAPAEPTASPATAGAPAASTAASPSVAAAAESPAAAASASPAATSGPAAASAAPATPGPGSGVITGKATGPGGEPLAGALIRATAADHDMWGWEPDTHPGMDTGAPPPRVDVETRVREYRDRLLRLESAEREATTDSTGCYALSGLSSGRYRIEAWLQGWRLDRTQGDEWGTVPSGGTCDFRGTRLSTVRASVLLPDGTSAKRANVSWRSLDGSEECGAAQWTPESPEFAVDHGSWEFTATADVEREEDSSNGTMRFTSGIGHRFADDDGPAYESEPLEATVGTGDPPALVFRLRGRPGIRVKVTFASPERPRFFRIAAMPLDATAGAGPARLLEERDVVSAWLGDEPEGVLLGLEPGSHLVGVTFRGDVVGPTTTVQVGNDIATAELRVPAGDVRDWVKVWVLGPDGSAVTDARIEAGCRGTEGRGEAECDPQPQPDGSLRIEHFSHGAPSGSSSFSGDGFGPGPRTWFLRATSPRHGRIEVVYDPARDREVTLAFAAPAILKVTVTGLARGADRDRIQLYLEDRAPDSSEQHQLQGPLDRNGTGTFPPVVPGSYDVVMKLASREERGGRRWRHWDASEVARVPVVLGAGTTSVSVPLVAVHDLVVSFDGDAPSLEQLAPDGTVRDSKHGRRDDDRSTMTFPDIPPGRYRLLGENGDMWVEVPASSTVAFRPAPYNAYHIELLGQGYLHEIGLRTGDLVVAIDGADFKDRLSMDAALATSKTRETAVFTILRDGQRFDVTADGRRFEEDQQSYYRPWTR